MRVKPRPEKLDLGRSEQLEISKISIILERALDNWFEEGR
jgi:hypothetical protein